MEYIIIIDTAEILKVLEVVIISAPLLYNIVSSKKKNDSGEVTLNFKECNIQRMYHILDLNIDSELFIKL